MQSESTGSLQTSAKVKQIHKKAPSCDICRHRRVACERPDSASVCKKCAAHGIRCTTTHTSRRTNVRSGKRIEEAKEKYGTDEAATTLLAMQSPESRVVGRELSTLLGNHLLEVFFDKSGMVMDKAHLVLPFMQWADFEDRLEACGRRPSDMEPEDELICQIALASAAQITDHPCILGPSPPTLSSLRYLPSVERYELHRYGKARRSACRALAQHAQQLCDERGVWRSPSPNSVAALLLMRQVVCDGEIHAKEGRPYLSAAVEQLRELDRSMGESVAWTAMLTDAFSAAEAGWDLFVSEEDYLSFALGRPVPGRLPSSEEIRIALSLPHPVLSVVPASPVSHLIASRNAIDGPWSTIVILARNIVRSLTSPCARRKPTIDSIFVHDAWKALDDILRWVQLADAVRQEQDWLSSAFFEVHFSLIWQSCISLEYVIMKVINDRLSAYEGCVIASSALVDGFSTANSGTLNLPVDHEYQLLTILLVNSRSRVEINIRDVLILLKSDRGIDSLALGTGSFWSVSRLHGFAEVLVSTTISFNNTVDQKLAAIDSLLDSVVQVSWTWPVLKETILMLQSERISLMSHMAGLSALMSWPTSDLQPSNDISAEQQSFPPEMWMDQVLHPSSI